MNYLDTHFYDGKLKERALPYRDRLENIKFISHADKMSILDRLDSKLTDQMAKQMLSVIKNEGTSSSNYDSSNNLWAIDVLIWIIEYMELSESNYEDTLPILQEQLADIAHGGCPPGRTTRIFQTIINCIESKTETPI
jgi:hypothetical protein